MPSQRVVVPRNAPPGKVWLMVWFSPADGSDGSDDQPRQRREVVADNESETERIAG
jgi:hypothetical protein